MLLPIIVFASGAAFFALIALALARAAGLADEFIARARQERRELLDLTLQRELGERACGDVVPIWSARPTERSHARRNGIGRP